MAIDFMVIKSPLASHPTGYAARVQANQTIPFERVMDMVAHRHTTVAKSEVLSVLEDFFETVEELLQDGKAVATPQAILRTTIRGNFESEADQFDPQRHEVVVRIAPGKRLRRAIRKVQVRKVKWEKPHPRPLVWIDVATGIQNGPLTPGGDGRLIGTGLRFDPDDPQQGVFFIAEDESESRAGWPTLNMPGQVILHNPLLPEGRYRVEVRAVMNNYELRAGRLDQVLVVETKGATPGVRGRSSRGSVSRSDRRLP